MFTLFFPRKVLEINSKINKRVEVYEWLGKYSVKVAGLTQSGGFVEDIWKKALKEIKKNTVLPEKFSILILGLGCGTLAKILSKSFPYAEILGVEIDEAFIEIGKKFFELEKISRLKIVNDEAERVVRRISLTKKRFFLIFLDCYVGEDFPKNLEKEKFLRLLKNLLEEKGFLIINRLYYKEKKQETDLFLKKLNLVFPSFLKVRFWSNLLVFCQKNGPKK